MQCINRKIKNSPSLLNRKRKILSSKSKKTKDVKHHQKTEENTSINFDLVKDNFVHLLHLNWEEEKFEKELDNLGK